MSPSLTVEWSAATVIFVCSAVFVSAILRGITGFGFALAAVPLISIALSPTQGVVIAVLLQCMIGFRDLPALRHLVARTTLMTLSAGALIGTPLGLMTLYALSADVMRVVIALIVLAALLALFKQVRINPGPRRALAAGMLAGLFSGMAAMPGPPAVAYLLGTSTPALQTRATLTIFFFITSLFTLPGFWVQGMLVQPTLLMALASFPLLIIGTHLGGWLFRQLGDGRYEKAAIAMLGATAMLAALRGVLGLL
ncbi:sulfite exporter TauE/SafE family protein [Paracoccus benzoatiresistens]|uniref:Probable membrane transporter protein n=1 Tax=Paracoccus benzoatiresistens TaxID=2997341 RepID=A0ABT4JD51_9RHOB|nr:sulfite exporter TauE/SafE family protein [Paracoccus sp. EF6]MCZ0964283.1 sulfite exporter TauE/SafE family protein [Paracoccus sp. EF6]